MPDSIFFIVSSGRSGTAMLQKALGSRPGVEMHHEFHVETIQPLAVRNYLGLVNAEECRRVIAGAHGAAIKASTATHWGDSSNKLSWLIGELAAEFPKARFVHLARDGRKVASSYFHKLGAECYDDRSTAMLAAHLDDPARIGPPPPEKKYWWPRPRPADPAASAFGGYCQFQRIAWHWAEINRVILDDLGRLSPDRTLFVRLEDLRESPALTRSLYQFLGLPFQDAAFAQFARPHNVNRPQDRLLDSAQRAQFNDIAGKMMERLGYAGQPEYKVSY